MLVRVLVLMTVRVLVAMRMCEWLVTVLVRVRMIVIVFMVVAWQ